VCPRFQLLNSFLGMGKSESCAIGVGRGNLTLTVCVYSLGVKVHYENDGDTFRSVCFCLLCDRAEGQLYEEDEALLCHGDMDCCVSGNYAFGLSWRESLIISTLNRQTCRASLCR